ncbi:MAG: AAA family ATPase [Verrucomicrobiae bacterium]|nr:AAA family ATPase [Verrucomicrobiae bacterium]
MKISHYRKLSDELGIELKKRDAPSAASFGGMMAFGEAFKQFLADSNPKDWTDVQSFIWVCCRRGPQSGYAAPFDQLFAPDEAAGILDDFAAVIKALEKAPGYKTENLSVSIPGTGTTRVRLAVNYGAWRVFAYVSRNGQKGFDLAVSKSGSYGGQLEERKMFDKATDAGEFGLHFVNENDYREMPDETWEEYLTGLIDIVAAFAGQRATPYQCHHRPELYQLIMSAEERPRILKEGIDMTDVDEPTPIPQIKPYSREEALSDLFMDDATFDQMIALLRHKKNLIIQGAPGVGKTFVARRLAYALMGEKDDDRARMIQFHQSYSYEDFIQGYRPDGKGGFRLKSGIFYTFCLRAQRDLGRNYFLVIDEINRGNLSKIFGELLMLIEADKRGTEHQLQLTYAETPDDTFHIPKNVHIIGTMNTADRSLSMVDYALRRRFAFVDLSPEFGSAKFREKLTTAGVSADLAERIIERMRTLNQAITADFHELGEGYQIGHSFFCPGNGMSPDERWYRFVVENEIKPLLREYWLDDPARVRAAVDALLAD